jgi:RNA polymerase sigma factor (sigma-70 family)
MGPPPFQAFLDANKHHVYRFLVTLVGRQEAEDCFQDTFAAALRAYPRLRDASNLRAWVMTIAHRKAMDAVRAASRRPEPVAEIEDAAVDDGRTVDVPVWDAVDGLPTKQRAAVVLRYGVGMRYREIGEVMGTSEAAARRSVHDAHRRLREVLA